MIMKRQDVASIVWSIKGVHVYATNEDFCRVFTQHMGSLIFAGSLIDGESSRRGAVVHCSARRLYANELSFQRVRKIMLSPRDYQECYSEDQTWNDEGRQGRNKLRNNCT